MNPNKDYYRILGVLEDAEDIVIKAAYKALAQKYHPDKYQGDAKHADERMKEINKAYAILSDVTARKKYDTERGKPEYEDDTTEDSDDLLHTLDKDWSDATEYFPDLVGLAFQLSKFSKQLEYTFKVIVIEKKDFNNRAQLAKSLKHSYLEKYFGTNKDIHEFAEEMIRENRRDILQQLNRAVNLLGSYVDPKIIINKILKEMELQGAPNKEAQRKYNPQSYILNDYASKLLAIPESRFDYNQTYVEYAVGFLSNQGVIINDTGFFTPKYEFSLYGKNYELSSSGLIDFAIAKARVFSS